MPRMSLTAGITERHLPVAISNDTSVFLFVAVHHSDGRTVSGLGKSDFVVGRCPRGRSLTSTSVKSCLGLPNDSPGVYIIEVAPKSMKWERRVYTFGVHLTPRFT